MGGLRLATIDVGTNTVILLVAELNGKGDLRFLEDRAEITRLERSGHSAWSCL